MDSLLVSVIVPTKDRPQLLEKALHSVLGQTYRNFEVIVVDDGSSPPVVLEAALVTDGRIRVLRMEVSRGPSAARNAGIEAARGAMITFLDDDDEFTPSRIENALSVLRDSSDEVALVESGHSGWLEDRLVYVHVPSRERDLRLSLLKEPSVALPAIMVKRSALEKVGLFDPALDRYEDWDLWLRMTDVYGAIRIPQVDVRRRLHHPIAAWTRLLDYARIFRRVAPRIRELPFRRQIGLWRWHGRFFAYRIIEVLMEVLIGPRLIQRIKIRRLDRAGFGR